jgi:hypothetical protein
VKLRAALIACVLATGCAASAPPQWSQGWCYVSIDSFAQDRHGMNGAYRNIAYTSKGIVGLPDCICLVREVGDSAWIPAPWLERK